MPKLEHFATNILYLDFYHWYCWIVYFKRNWTQHTHKYIDTKYHLQLGFSYQLSRVANASNCFWWMWQIGKRMSLLLWQWIFVWDIIYLFSISPYVCIWSHIKSLHHMICIVFHEWFIRSAFFHINISDSFLSHFVHRISHSTCFYSQHTAVNNFWRFFDAGLL